MCDHAIVKFRTHVNSMLHSQAASIGLPNNIV